MLASDAEQKNAEQLDELYAQFRDQTRFWIQRVAVPCIMVVGLFGNLVTVIIMTRRRMRSTTNMYLAALAFVDMLYLVLTFLLGLSHYPNMAEGRYYFYWKLKPFLMMLTDTCSNTSVWLTVTFTIERFIAVKYPMKGKVWCTEARAKKLITCVFVLGILFASPVPFEWRVVEKYAPAAPSSPSSSSIPLAQPDAQINGEMDQSPVSVIGISHKLNGNFMQPSNQSTSNAAGSFQTELERTGEHEMEAANDYAGTYTLALDYSAFGRNETYKTIYYWSTACIFYFIPLLSLTLFNGFLIRSVRQSQRERDRMTNRHNPAKPAATANNTTANNNKTCHSVVSFNNLPSVETKPIPSNCKAISPPLASNQKFAEETCRESARSRQSAAAAAAKTLEVSLDRKGARDEAFAFRRSNGQPVTITITRSNDGTRSNSMPMLLENKDSSISNSNSTSNEVYGDGGKGSSDSTERSQSPRETGQVPCKPASENRANVQRGACDSKIDESSNRSYPKAQVDRATTLETSANYPKDSTTLSLDKTFSTSSAEQLSGCSGESPAPTCRAASDARPTTLYHKRKTGGGGVVCTVNNSPAATGPTSAATSATTTTTTTPSASASNQERRITIMLIAVVILFLICQIPSAAMLMYTSVHETAPNSNEQALVLAFGNIFNFLMAVNAAGNFILYSFLSKKYRKTFVILFCTCLGSPSKNHLGHNQKHLQQGRTSYGTSSSRGQSRLLSGARFGSDCQQMLSENHSKQTADPEAGAAVSGQEKQRNTLL